MRRKSSFRVDMTGQRFGRLLVIEYLGQSDQRRSQLVVSLRLWCNDHQDPRVAPGCGQTWYHSELRMLSLRPCRTTHYQRRAPKEA